MDIIRGRKGRWRHWIISNSTCYHTCGNILRIASQEDDNIAAGHTKNEELSSPVASFSGFVNDIILAYCLFLGLVLASYILQPQTYITIVFAVQQHNVGDSDVVYPGVICEDCHSFIYPQKKVAKTGKHPGYQNYLCHGLHENGTCNDVACNRRL